MPTIAPAKLEQVTRDVFVARGVPAGDAGWIATLLVRANLRGHDSHGVIRIPHYVRAMKAGEVNPAPHITVESETPTIALIDGDQGFGQVVARRGITLAVEKAAGPGMAAGALKRTKHTGRPAAHAGMGASQGVVRV